MRVSKTVSTVLAAVALTLSATALAGGADAAVMKRLYLASNGRANSANGDGVLSWAPSVREVTDRYVFDPKNPAALKLTDAVGSDRREVHSRQDVLAYTTAPLERPLQVTGAIAVELYAASDARDVAFTAAIEDVQPDGKVVLLGSGPVGIAGGPSAAPSLLTAGKAARYQIDLGTIAHAFLPGHCIRLEISSSANLNQNAGNPIATDSDGKIANQRVFHDIAHPSNLVLRVVD